MRKSTCAALSFWCAATLAASSAYADTCTPPDPTADYQLVFADEFNGTELDRNRWNTEFLWGPGVIINNEQQYYVNEGQFGYDPFSVSEGVLTIQAIKAPFDRSQLYLTRSIYSASTVELLWRTPADAVSYNVYRDQALLGSASGGSFLDNGLDEGFDYAYEVEALDGDGNTIVTAQLTVNTAKRPLPPPAPTPFSLNLRTRIDSSTAAEILWDRPNRAGRFEIYRNGQMYRMLNGAGFQSLYETDLVAGETNRYRVVALDRCGDTIISAETEINTAEGVTPSAPPVTRLQLADVIYSKSTAEIFWEPLQGASSYEIFENGTLLTTTDARSVFVDGLVPGEDRRFTIIALDQDDNELDRESRTLNTADNSFALNRQPFLSGIITSYDSFRFLYGKAEIRARMPKGQGLWSAFWLLNGYYNQDQPEDPEIDIIEALGHAPTTAHQAYHYRVDVNGDGFHTDYESVELTSPIEDFSEAFHTYGVEWEEGLIVWYVDGVETHRITGPTVSSEQMYLLANLAVGGDFPGPADETTPLPARYEIDYIRVWQRR
ncbi:MAG: glycoside hydrolase family 16 protein [Gammaproteobacteria bacterium]|nr:glycoside hydrolase family 16 protein [Gammaproteobacteria bacterium]